MRPDHIVEKNANANANEIGGAVAESSAPLSPNDKDKVTEKEKERHLPNLLENTASRCTANRT